MNFSFGSQFSGVLLLVVSTAGVLSLSLEMRRLDPAWLRLSSPPFDHSPAPSLFLLWQSLLLPVRRLETLVAPQTSLRPLTLSAALLAVSDISSEAHGSPASSFSPSAQPLASSSSSSRSTAIPAPALANSCSTNCHHRRPPCLIFFRADRVSRAALANDRLHLQPQRLPLFLLPSTSSSSTLKIAAAAPSSLELRNSLVRPQQNNGSSIVDYSCQLVIVSPLRSAALLPLAGALLYARSDPTDCTLSPSAAISAVPTR